MSVADVGLVGLEQRVFNAGFETRDALGVDGTGGDLVVTGYGAMLNQYDFRDGAERIKPGAFRETLSRSPDVVFWAQHGAGGHLPLARSTAGTLDLEEDSRGLRFTARLDPEDPAAVALHRSIKRGNMTGASFAFRVTSDAYSTLDDGRQLQTINTINLDKGDCSCVAFGANEKAFTQARAAIAGRAGRGPWRPDALQLARERLAQIRRAG